MKGCQNDNLIIALTLNDSVSITHGEKNTVLTPCLLQHTEAWTTLDQPGTYSSDIFSMYDLPLTTEGLCDGHPKQPGVSLKCW